MFDGLSPHTKAQQHLEHPRAESQVGNPQLSIQQLWHPEITQHPRASAPGAYKHQIILGKPELFWAIPSETPACSGAKWGFLGEASQEDKVQGGGPGGGTAMAGDTVRSRRGRGHQPQLWGRCRTTSSIVPASTGVRTGTDTHTTPGVHHLGWGGRLHPTWAPLWDGVTCQE